ncbi:MAG: hypothetical protein A2100_02360 [Sideroxydans sp. GWF2_59_14]|nr:MAG: hypothetical protein A2100_02360 [Sideroxydans sp. GWF2_59_14]HAF45181.1 hypothetical protein [Gallionellaceae bacterium]
MKAPFYVEVLTRSGEVRHRQRVDALPIRIGQGYDNDYILDDPHTSAHHVVIDRNEAGGLDVLDLGSRNGVVHKGKRSERLTIDGNTVFRLGHTNLRVRSADFSVADEMRDTTFHRWEGWPPALAGLVLLALLSLETTWLTDTDKTETVRYVTAMVGMLVAGLVWSGGWTLANRIFAGQTRFGRHLFIAASGMVVIEVVSLLLSLAGYAFSLETLTRFGGPVMIAITAGMVFFHLVTISPNNGRRYAIISVLLMLLGSALTLTFNYQNRGMLAEEPYMSELFAPSLHLTADHPIDEFLAEAGKLKAGIDEERSRVLSDEGESEDDEFD